MLPVAHQGMPAPEVTVGTDWDIEIMGVFFSSPSSSAHIQSRQMLQRQPVHKVGTTPILHLLPVLLLEPPQMLRDISCGPSQRTECVCI